MTVTEAQAIRKKYLSLAIPTQEEKLRYTEAMKFLIDKTKDSDFMVELGAMYYEEREFELALDYYEMAAEYGNLYAISNLGYIWYYGRIGEKDYEKAFYYFDKARQMGDLIAAYKVADMYKNGFHVEKDEAKYKSIIEEPYQKVKDSRYVNDPVPEVFTRLARIRRDEGKTAEALQLYDTARDFLEQRIRVHSFFGDLNIMKWMIWDIYRLRDFDPENIGLYDLYYLLQKPVIVEFRFGDTLHEVEAVPEDGGLVVRFDDQWYRTVDDFFQEAVLDRRPLTMRYEELQDMRIREWT